MVGYVGASVMAVFVVKNKTTATKVGGSEESSQRLDRVVVFYGIH